MFPVYARRYEVSSAPHARIIPSWVMGLPVSCRQYLFLLLAYGIGRNHLSTNATTGLAALTLTSVTLCRAPSFNMSSAKHSLCGRAKP